jgi:beta-RFAP synthase
MFSFGDCQVRQFGGAGIMVDRPGLELHIEPADELQVAGRHAARVREVALRCAARWGDPAALRCRLHVVTAPAAHVGLGLGTQLALATAAGLRAWLELPPCPIDELAHAAGRAGRSSVGTHGFALGGLVVEAGKHRDHELGPLVAQVPVCEQWHFVLAAPRHGRGRFGSAERQAFEQLPPVPRPLTDAMCRVVLLELLPACSTADFAAFSRALFALSCLAGECFAAQQHGRYATAETAALVDALRAEGIEGIGQSSWGPTVYALLPSAGDAQRVASWLRERFAQPPLTIHVAAPRNHGAIVDCEPRQCEP